MVTKATTLAYMNLAMLEIFLPMVWPTLNVACARTIYGNWLAVFVLDVATILTMSPRNEPIVLQIVKVMLFCTAHEIVKSCSKMCLADGIDELAVLGKSLDSVGFSLSRSATLPVVAILAHRAVTDMRQNQ